MKRVGTYLKAAYLFVTTFTVLLSLGTATYAWFSVNMVVKTNQVSARTNVDTVSLLLSTAGGGSFQGSAVAILTQVNSHPVNELYPVSTADLRNYVFSPGTVEGKAKYFEKVEDEKYIYHGRIYVKAEATAQHGNARMALFLDESVQNGGAFLMNAGAVPNAARLGILIDHANPVILRFGDTENPAGERENNTYPDDTLMEAGNVLVMDENGTVKAVKDPSVNYQNYLVPEAGVFSSTVPLCYLNLNQIYVLDVFFYLEGCDPDCTDYIENIDFDFQIGLYGILTEEVP